MIGFSMSISYWLIIYLAIGLYFLVFFVSYNNVTDKHSLSSFTRNIVSGDGIDKLGRLLFVIMWVFVFLYYLFSVTMWIVSELRKPKS